MQQLAHINIYDEKLLVLVRRTTYGTCLKLRKSGEDGPEMTDEQGYLEMQPTLVNALKQGATVYC